MSSARYLSTLALLVVLVLAGCFGEDDFRQPWRDQKLPSGKTVKITQCLLAWGAEHDERFPDQDLFATEFIYTDPGAPDSAHEQEAREVFELSRATSELWGFKTASVAGFRQMERKGQYDLYIFTRGTDGAWTFKREARTGRP